MSNSRRRRRGHKPGQRRAPGDPDDFVDLPFGYMARWGRFNEMRGTLSAEDHTQMVGALVDTAADLRDEQQGRRARLLEILHEADAVDLIARTSLTYLHIDPDTFKEWESDRSPAHVEYLALQALGAGELDRKAIDPVRASELTFEAIDIVREMFRTASMLIAIEGIVARRDRPGDSTIEYVLKTRLESLGVRGSGYAEHLIRVLHGCMDPFDAECREMLGFTSSEAVTLADGIADLVADRVEPRHQEAAAGRSETLRQLKRERRKRGGKRQIPEWILDLPPNEAKLQVSTLTAIWMFADSRSLASVTSAALASHCSIDEATCRAFLDAYSCTDDLFDAEHHALPGGAHPFTTNPILRTEDGYVLPVPSSLLDALRPRMEDQLRAKSAVWDRYVKARGRYVEQEAAALLAGALPGSRSWTGINWQSTNDESDLDGLVAADEVSVRLQCKAGRLSAPSRRGAPARMKRDVGELIQGAAEQHAALGRAIDEEGAVQIGFSREQAAALAARLQVEAVIVLDDITVWATETRKLRSVGALTDDRPVPWVLALTDLMVVVDLLQGSQLVHYLLRRQRIERDGRIEAHDELDWVGHYITDGLFFDRFFDRDDPPDTFRLLSYTEPIDAWYFTRAGLRTVEAPKPAQSIPDRLARLIERLEKDRPTGWTLAAVALLDGDQESRDLWEQALQNALDRVPTRGWSNASQIYQDRLGVTFYVDLRTAWPEIRARVEDYSRAKMDELGESNWITIGEGATGGLFVLVIDRSPGEKTIADLFLEPPLDRGGRREVA